MTYPIIRLINNWKLIGYLSNKLAYKYGSSTKVIYNISYTLNELLQNCTRYYHSKDDNINVEICQNPLQIKIQSFSNKYNKDKLKTTIDILNKYKHQSEAMYELYINKIKVNSSNSGIGLISMMRKFENDLNYTINVINKDKFSIDIIVIINEP